MTGKERLEQFANRIDNVANELREIQKMDDLSLAANHECGVVLSILRYSVADRLRKLAGKEK